MFIFANLIDQKELQGFSLILYQKKERCSTFAKLTSKMNYFQRWKLVQPLTS